MKPSELQKGKCYVYGDIKHDYKYIFCVDEIYLQGNGDYDVYMNVLWGFDGCEDELNTNEMWTFVEKEELTLRLATKEEKEKLEKEVKDYVEYMTQYF